MKRHRSAVLIPLAILCMPTLSGCSHLGLFSRVHLEKLPLTSIQASLPKGPGIAPGEKSPLVITIALPDGTLLKSKGAGKGKVAWNNLQIMATLVTVNNKGIVSLPADPRISEGKVPHIIVTVPSHPDLQAEIDVPVRYDYNFNAHFYGQAGSSGLSGTSGIDGNDGIPGSTDPDHPSAGGDGSDGTNGSNGEDGGQGGDGPAVRVRVALKQDVHPLLQVAVSTAFDENFYLVDPQGGSLTVTSAGGPGGSGGKGGRGGRGGSGGIGSPNGRSGNSGINGSDGPDGPSGNGGPISVTYDPQVKSFLSAIRVLSPGGPKPVFFEQPVPPLW